MPTITPAQLSQIQELSKIVLAHGLTTGEVHPILGEPLDPDVALEMLEQFWLTHQVEFSNASIDFLFAVLQAQFFPDTPIEEFREKLGELSTEQLTELAEADAAQVEAARVQLIASREQVIADFKAIASVVVRGAIASAMAAALGLA